MSGPDAERREIFRDRNPGAKTRRRIMAVVIPLAPLRRAQTSEAPAAARQEPATILFFTGVRYERPAEPAAPEPAVRRRRRIVPALPAGSPKRTKKATNARQPA
jgi:hypothetical protein